MTNQRPEVSSVEQLDLDRYLGLWYEIGRLPLKFEDEGATDITAEYSLQDNGKVRVDNRCFDEDGKPTQAVGEATPDEEHPGRLSVTFLPTGLRWIPNTRADYWVLKVDADYRHALVGTPNHKNLWILGREPHIAPAVEAEYLAEAERQGFDLTDWIRPDQLGHRVTDDRL